MDLTQAVAIDIESNDLLSGMLDFSSFPYKLNKDAKMWCISFCNIGTGEITSLVKEKVTKENIDSILKDYKFIVFHNGVKFDALVLQLFGLIDYKIGWLDESDTLNGREVRFLDTLILSRLLSPDRYGGHSLKAWGERLGEYKDDFRKECIELGIIQKDSPKGAEFKTFSEGMVSYCEQDTKVTSELFKHLLMDIASYSGWKQAIKMEHKLADLAIRRESLGFWFDKDFAIKCVEDLTIKMQELADKVNPILPPKQMNKTTLSKWQAPKNQLTKKGEPTASLKNFAEKVGGEIFKVDDDYILQWEGHQIHIPFEGYLRTTEEATISDLDHVKSHLIDLGWIPTEWAVRDLTKDSKKQNLSFEKRLEAFDRWFKATMEGKYREFRLDDLEGDTIEEKYLNVKEKLNGQFPVRVLTSPKIRVGVEKELCPNLEKLGEKVAFAKDFALYLTYKHRKSSIAGGDLEDVDYDEEYPNTGYLASYREADGRVPTPAIEIGASTNRYRHVSIANVARSSSIYGKEMRSLFGCGEGFVQTGFDFSSLEARVQGHYVLKYPFGEELAESLVAEKPNDIHCYSEDTEILTEKGWKLFGDLTFNDKVAQYWEKDGSVDYTTPDEIIWQDYEGDMIAFKSVSTDFLVTPNHRMLICNDTNRQKQVIKEAKDFLENSFTSKRFLTAGVKLGGEYINSTLLKVIVATQADGTLSKDCSAIVFNFKKQVKVKRLLILLQDLKADYSLKEHKSEKRGTEWVIRIKASELTTYIRSLLINKSFSSFILNCSLENRLDFLEELGFWDGTVRKNGDIVVDSTDFKSIDMIQAVASISGVKSKTKIYTKKTIYGETVIKRVYISNVQKPYCSVKDSSSVSPNYKGKIGCVSVPSTLVIVRRNGTVMVSGNTVNSQKLGIDRSTVKSVTYAILYGCSPKKLEQMLGFTASEAKKFYSDYWDAVPALRDLKRDVEIEWEQVGGKEWLKGIDGRKLNSRSRHSLINLLFQSCGVIAAKYVTVFLLQDMEKQGLCIDPFINKPDVCSMIEYHK